MDFQNDPKIYKEKYIIMLINHSFSSKFFNISLNFAKIVLKVVLYIRLFMSALKKGAYISWYRMEI